ncbi:MAG: phosphopantetheine-binding protein [Acidobacteriota bacterium]
MSTSSDGGNDQIMARMRALLEESSTEEYDWSSITRETTFEEIGIDSLSILDLLYDVDQEFGVPLEASEVIDLRTLGEFADLLVERQKA